MLSALSNKIYPFISRFLSEPLYFPVKMDETKPNLFLSDYLTDLYFYDFILFLYFNKNQRDNISVKEVGVTIKRTTSTFLRIFVRVPVTGENRNRILLETYTLLFLQSL